MKRLFLLTVFLVSTSFIAFAQSHARDAVAVMDVKVHDYMRAAFFFMSLSYMEERTGLPIKENEWGNNRYRWAWSPTRGQYERGSYFDEIFSAMRRGGFEAAFVLNTVSPTLPSNRLGRVLYSYTTFLIYKGVEYVDFMNLYDVPIPGTI